KSAKRCVVYRYPNTLSCHVQARALYTPCFPPFASYQTSKMRLRQNKRRREEEEEISCRENRQTMPWYLTHYMQCREAGGEPSKCTKKEELNEEIMCKT